MWQKDEILLWAEEYEPHPIPIHTPPPKKRKVLRKVRIKFKNPKKLTISLQASEPLKPI